MKNSKGLITMKAKLFALLLFLSGMVYAQNVQLGISAAGTTLEIKIKPSGVSYTTSDQLTDAVFTIRWLNSYGVTLGAINTAYSIQKAGVEAVKDNYRYQIFAFSGTPVSLQQNWPSGSENIILTVSVNQTGTGVGSFELIPAGFLTGGQGDPYVEVNLTNVTNASTPYFQQSIGGVPLPVELTSFTASAELSKVQLNWETATEVNNYGFEIERSPNLGSPEWKKIAFVPGNGNSSSLKSYSYTDKNIVGGTDFIYRLKQLDSDGQFSYSDQVEVQVMPVNYELYQNYPNPFNPSTTLRFSLIEPQKVSIKVYNQLGEEVVEVVNREFQAGFHEVEFNASGFASGVYIYRLSAGKFSSVKKMMLLK